MALRMTLSLGILVVSPFSCSGKLPVFDEPRSDAVSAVSDSDLSDSGITNETTNGSSDALDTGSAEVLHPADTFDPDKDFDGDGYVAKDDCNDHDPLVNPGAFDVPGDGIDNDCDGLADEPEPDCDSAALKFDSTSPPDFAKALGICRETTDDAKGKAKRWGLIKSELLHADGTATTDVIQYGLLKKFGDLVTPRQGKNLAVLSSGTARTPDLPGFIVPMQPSWKGMSEVAPPMGWPKTTMGCPAPVTVKANDSVALKLSVRVPTNAKSFRYNFNLFTSEYLNFVCSEYNDQFVALLDSKAPLPSLYDKNISFDSDGMPIGANSELLLDACTPGNKAATSSSSKAMTFKCLKGVAELAGTGFWDPKLPKEQASTSWLETQAGVVPGEVITLTFMVWDVGDHIFDTSVLLDNWRWDAKAIALPVTDRAKM
ncbi:MAG: hypothetical protein NVS3B20_04040 [Polyangiales bacterium]